MSFTRKVKAGTCTSRVAVSYRAEFVSEERIRLNLDTTADTALCQLRIYDRTGKVIAERVIRSIPASLEFTAKATGRYEMELSTVGTGTNQVNRAFTWSDWDRDFSGGADNARMLPDGIIAIAFLTVT
ncbi:MAG: hypothetical protein IPM54_04465 [Polyangiaceae bacterium]|nr:hypothetical protein [Polyangiaceae bacterium]